MGQLRHIFYAQPYPVAFLEMGTAYIIWTFLMLLLRGKSGRIVACIGVALSLVLIVKLTIVGRSESGEVVLIPFSALVRGFTHPGYLRSALMNIILFLPFGLTLPFALPCRVRHKVLITVLAGALLSVGVEVLQLAFALGSTEADDVITNTLGTLLGATSWQLCVYIRNKYDSWLR